MIRTTLLYALLGLLALGAAYVALAAVQGRKQALALVFGSAQHEPVDFSTLKLKDTPNQYLLCPEGYCEAPAHAVAPNFPVPVQELQDAWFELVAAQPSTRVIASDEDARQFDIETLTPLVGFPDTITVRFLETPDGGSTMAIYSRSFYGKSDLGANKKRLDAWLGQLAVRLG
ncbi:MAG: DUF1499 domain-containing protein [Acidobacteria bacterium]|nr:DUF1499 domain-containing protein [Acidobacteriota bacterium]